MERLAHSATVVSVPTGQVVFRQGDAGDRFYIIESGKAEVVIDGIHVSTLFPGDCFGEIALLRDVPRMATIESTSDLELRAIARRPFLAAVTGHTEARTQADRVMSLLLAGE